nr:MAG TPA: hypothetical protein [Caudoviricetes sp.]
MYFRVKHDNNWYGWCYVIGQEKKIISRLPI